MTGAPYTMDTLTALQAQRHALEIVFGPMLFQVAWVMRRIGLLDLLADPGHPEGWTLEETCAALRRGRYPLQVLVEAGLSGGILHRRPDGPDGVERYRLTKAGHLLAHDATTGVLMDFVQDVCYLGIADLDRAIETGEPAGLRRLGDWPTLYAALDALPAAMRGAWYRYDHYFSDRTFSAALGTVFDPAPRTLLDVGGNTGRWALRCVAHDAGVEVAVLDLPQQAAQLAGRVAGQPGAERIRGIGVDLLGPDARIPGGFDVIWMSQFLDCFAASDIVRLLRLAAEAMTPDTRLYINEIYWDRQRFETAAFVATQSSPYFTAMANGHSIFLAWADMDAYIVAAGLTVEANRDGLGLGHTLTCCRLARPNPAPATPVCGPAS
jgi:hypothetical protein